MCRAIQHFSLPIKNLYPIMNFQLATAVGTKYSLAVYQLST